MTTTYSAFFSSGLLAPPNLYPKASRSPPSSPAHLPSSPALVPPSPGPTRGSSPMAIPDDSDVEDLDVDMDEDGTRARTPTPSSVGAKANHGPLITASQHQSQNQRPRLRKRRSSLTVATSPMCAIKSPQRNAGNAIHFQQRMATGSIGRSRSGSLNILGLGTILAAEEQHYPQDTNVASQGTSLIGRMRSGSVGGSTLGNFFRPRRTMRRLASVPAPAPPPTAPLPALPTEPTKHSKTYSLFHNTSIFSNPKAIFSQVASMRQPLAQRAGPNGDAPASPTKAKGRERAHSCTKGVMVDASIDEEMKEN